MERTPRLGLRGELRLTVPALNLAAERLRLGVALADHLEVIALEGDLLTVPNLTLAPTTLMGTPKYHFEQPFYRGETVNAVLYYQAPLED